MYQRSPLSLRFLIQSNLAAQTTQPVAIPATGAEPACDGQVAVVADMPCMNPDHYPHFVKRNISLNEEISSAGYRYIGDIQDGTFLAESHSLRAIARLSGSRRLSQSNCGCRRKPSTWQSLSEDKLSPLLRTKRQLR